MSIADIGGVVLCIIMIVFIVGSILFVHFFGDKDYIDL